MDRKQDKWMGRWKEGGTVGRRKECLNSRDTGQESARSLLTTEPMTDGAFGRSCESACAYGQSPGDLHSVKFFPSLHSKTLIRKNRVHRVFWVRSFPLPSPVIP